MNILTLQRLPPIFALSAALAAWPGQLQAGPLENYVTKPDDTFTWKQTREQKRDEATITAIDMTSQTWRDIAWQHKMLIVRPDKIRNPDIGFLFITGDGDPAKMYDVLKTVAERGGAVAAVITRVPN